MKQTKKQAETEVLRLQKTLQGITPAQKVWFESKSLPHRIYYKSAHNCWCTHCGHKFSVGEVGESCTCPNCGATYKTEKSSKNTFQEFAYSVILATRGDWQVVRYFITEAHVQREGYMPKSRYAITYAPSFYTTEVMQKWFNPTTSQSVNFRLYLRSFPNYKKIPYDLDSCFRIVRHERPEGYYGLDYDSEWMLKKAYPIGKILPYYKKYGLTMKNAGDVWLDLFMEKIAGNNFAETLVKKGHIELAMKALERPSDFEPWQRQVMLALRHGFDFRKVHYFRDYFDYLRQLQYLGYDLHSPKYLCPVDFYTEHARLGELEREKRKVDSRKEAMKKYGKEYAQRMEKFKDLCIIGYGMEIRPLMTIQSVYEEGKYMHHCVFECGYYQQPETLLLSATLNGERCETIELNMTSWKIMQSRGLQNKSTPQHDNIIKLMQSNMGQIKRLAS